jgi:UDP-N-acetylglucosamine 2-epimerase
LPEKGLVEADHAMSQIFFDEMGIPKPVRNLQVKSSLHGEMTGTMLAGIETEIISRKPDWVLVYGDTNSTLAGALAASKLHVPVAHVEAGLRSFNRRMPEEVNRILTDHVSDMLFCPTMTAVNHLKNEGFTNIVNDGKLIDETLGTAFEGLKNPQVVNVGDVMYDAALVFGGIAKKKSAILENLSLNPGEYFLLTLHRAENTDDISRLQGILSGIKVLAEETKVVFPVHPRTRGKIMEAGLQHILSEMRNLACIELVSFLDMVRLEQGAKVILTDSGGIQREAYFHGVPCVTLRDETEWGETLAAGWNRIAGANADEIVSAVKCSAPGRNISEYGQGRAAEIIVSLLAEWDKDRIDIFRQKPETMKSFGGLKYVCH